jgi:6-phosphogluconate dehydrogenase
MQAVAALRGQFGGHAVKMLDDAASKDDGQVEVHHGAEPKQDDAGEKRVGAGQDGGEVPAEGASDAGPSSGSGATEGGDGPTSGSGDTHPG